MTMARVRTVFTGVAGTPWYSNLYFANDGGVDGSGTFVGQTNVYWNAIKGAINNQITWTVEGDVPQIDEVTGNLVGVTSVSPQTGTMTGSDDPLPWATQALVRLNTNAFVHNRNVRGRIFIPGCGETNSADGNVASGLVSALDTATNNLIGAVTDLLVVWSRPFAGSEGNPARLGSYHFVETASTDTKWSVLRSRRD